MSALSEKVVVVAGGTGSLGEGICNQFLSNGAEVVVPYRTEAKAEQLRDYVRTRSGDAVDRLHLYPAWIGEEQSVQEFREKVLTDFRHIDLAVASIGRSYYGYSLCRMPVDHFQQIIQDNLMTHFLFMRAMLSHMHDSDHGTYVMVNGGESEVVAPESGPISIVAAAQRMMTQALACEEKGRNVRVYSVVAFHPVKTRDRRREVMDEWLTPEALGEYIVRLYNGDVPDPAKITHTLYTNRDL